MSQFLRQEMLFYLGSRRHRDAHQFHPVENQSNAVSHILMNDVEHCHSVNLLFANQWKAERGSTADDIDTVNKRLQHQVITSMDGGGDQIPTDEDEAKITISGRKYLRSLNCIVYLDCRFSRRRAGIWCAHLMDRKRVEGWGWIYSFYA
jgi:hypothetical protein